jgi:four helix bundle protein
MATSVVQSFKDLQVWQKSMDLAEMCYRLTAEFPRDEMYGMTAQARRAAVSVAANIAEGHGRETTGSFIQFLRMAQGSLKELETHLLLAERAEIASTEKIVPLLAECETIGKMLRSLIRSLQSRVDNHEPDPRPA